MSIDGYGLGMVLQVRRGDADVNFPFASSKSSKLSDAAAKRSLTLYKGPHAPKDREERGLPQSQMLTQWINKDWAAGLVAEMKKQVLGTIALGKSASFLDHLLFDFSFVFVRLVPC